jgi:hypothetical protein
MLREITAAEARTWRRPKVAIVGDPAQLVKALQLQVADCVAAAEVVGCPVEDVVELHGDRYGELTPKRIIAQGRRGLRGRVALDAALKARVTATTGRPLLVARQQRTGERRPARRLGSRRRVTPARLAEDPPPSDPDDLAASVEAAVARRRAVAEFSGMSPIFDLVLRELDVARARSEETAA